MSVASSGASYSATNFANSYINNYGNHPEIQSTPVKSNESSGLATGNEMSVNFFNTNNENDYNSVFEHESRRLYDPKSENIFRVYGHGGNGSIWDKNKSIGKSKTFDIHMSAVAKSWELKKDDNKTILILYSCLSANSGPGGSSIGQKISNNHKNITVVAFDGYVMYTNGMFSGRISSVSKNYLSIDGLGEMVIFIGGVEIQRSLFQSPWEYYLRSLRN